MTTTTAPSLLTHFTTALATLTEAHQFTATTHLLGAFEYLNRAGCTDPDQWRAAVDAAVSAASDPAAVGL